MDEHVIRLRAAWRGEFAGGSGPAERRVDLPTDWEPDIRSPFVLTRSFHRPRTDPRVERISLRVDRAPGVRNMSVAETVLEPMPGAPFPWDFDLPETLPERIELRVRVDPADWAGDPELAMGWGIFALVIRPRD